MLTTTCRKPAARRLIRLKLNTINRLHQENIALRQAAADKEKALTKYAREYVSMGDECLKLDMKEAAMEVYEVHGWSQELVDEAFATLAEIRGE